MYKDIQEFTRSKIFQGMLIGFGLGLVAFLIFQAGILVGSRKAAFSYGFGDNYYRVFDRPMPGSPHDKLFFAARGGFPGDLIEGHGAAGEVLNVNLPTFIVAGPDDAEKVVLVGEDTVIRRFRDTVPASEIAEGDFTVVIGEPNDNGQIQAKLIRLLPPPPDFETTIRGSEDL